ncbi:MAG: MarR family winged helix-turn-helix transcriptional regulator [Gammaproteobacteria bacterium]
MTKSQAKPAADFGILLNTAFGAFKDALHVHLAEGGFDDVGPSFGYVFRLLEEGPLNLRAVADALAITPQGALKIVNDMVEKGYVERADDAQDKRVRALSLTPRAHAAIARARAFHRNFERQLGKRVGPETAAAARIALEDIVAHHGHDGRAHMV